MGRRATISSSCLPSCGGPAARHNGRAGKDVFNLFRVKTHFCHRIQHINHDCQSHVFALDCAKTRSEEHTSELQSLMRISYAVFCLKKKTNINTHNDTDQSLHHD